MFRTGSRELEGLSQQSRVSIDADRMPTAERTGALFAVNFEALFALLRH